MLTSKKLNDIIVKKVRLPKLNNKEIRGSEILPIYSNTFICARKKSGKSTCIYNMLKKCCDKDTILHLFVSTIGKDPTWKAIVKYFTDKGCIVNSHTSTIDLETGKDMIREILDDPIVEESEDEESSSSDSDYGYLEIDRPSAEEKKEQKKKVRKMKKTKKAQKQVIVLDDLGDELKRRSIDQLLKINRHLKCKVILSTQYLNDLSIQARRQIDIWMCFSGLKSQKLQQIMRDCDTRLTFDQFEEVYKFCTSGKYNFMYLDTSNDMFRKNFNERVMIET
jgi:hypothetical protein